MKYAHCIIVLLIGCTAIKAQKAYDEQYRPQVHFSPEAHWMNDPNGMVYYQGTYHLFFQYYPGASTWGPMHWGHATSGDMVHWQQQAVALYPDSLGFIFSGSAVVDSNNTSGLGKNGIIPLVAIFTQHDTSRAKALTNTFQNESIAYSLDSGKTWVKYAHNPVLKNPGISDFRDPKVCWYAPGKKWIMTLATKDRVTFYSSPNLKDWAKESETGSNFGAHGGVWECPDLFALDYKGKKVWVLMVSINPGGPNGGSATQYFTGQFNGHGFIPYDTATRWVDYGPDDYAGVTWSNTSKRKIFLGWMSNWDYAQVVPTTVWRSANTLPRELGLKKTNGAFFITSQPIRELDVLIKDTKTVKTLKDSAYSYNATVSTPLKVLLTTSKTESFAVVFSNDAGEKTLLGYDRQANEYYIDRSQSANIHFFKKFGVRHSAARIGGADDIQMEIYADASSFELFADGGLSVMSSLVFPSKPYNKVEIHQDADSVVKTFSVFQLKSIW
jgi:fructan beta-fructosidase